MQLASLEFSWSRLDKCKSRRMALDFWKDEDAEEVFCPHWRLLPMNRSCMVNTLVMDGKYVFKSNEKKKLWS